MSSSTKLSNDYCHLQTVISMFAKRCHLDLPHALFVLLRANVHCYVQSVLQPVERQLITPQSYVLPRSAAPWTHPERSATARELQLQRVCTRKPLPSRQRQQLQHLRG